MVITQSPFKKRNKKENRKKSVPSLKNEYGDPHLSFLPFPGKVDRFTFQRHGKLKKNMYVEKFGARSSLITFPVLNVFEDYFIT